MCLANAIFHTAALAFGPLPFNLGLTPQASDLPPHTGLKASITREGYRPIQWLTLAIRTLVPSSEKLSLTLSSGLKVA
jgi:hypothetical protein